MAGKRRTGKPERHEIRVFMDVRRPHREPIVVLRLDGRALHVERGVGMSMRGRKATSRSHTSAEAASLAFDKECTRLEELDHWWEIQAVVRFQPETGNELPPDVRNALLDSSRAAFDAQTSALASSRDDDRSQLLRDLVGKGKRVKVKGSLLLPTGRLVVADPTLIERGEALPFEQQLPPGKHPVVLSMRDDRVAAASVILSNDAPETWHLAMPRGMKKLVPAKYRTPSSTPGYTYPVDSATS